ncbi:MAG: sodium:alanine symporter family protein [Clostridia bacterium]|nr:sodium:alanine symporter family protein [Clostridia bacterium]
MDNLFLISNVFNDAAAVLLFGSGLYFTFRFGFFQFKGLGEIFSKTVGGMIGKNKDKTAFRLFSTSLAGAAGVGNITGVATAIAMGGPGAVFWMWVAAFLGMATKYAETRFAVIYRQRKNGYNSSPMEYIFKGTKNAVLPFIFAFFGIIVSFLMGNLIQSRAACEAIYEATETSQSISGPLMCIVITIVIFGGFKRIGKFTEKAVPIMTGLYTVMCAVVIIIYRENIISSVFDIFIYAFKPMSAFGGFTGASISAAVRCGVSKGIFSNEAGLGSAGLAYGNTESSNPDDHALWGAFDVFADTIIISSFSAFAILTSDIWKENGSIISVFDKTMGSIGGALGAVCIVLFAVASIITWEYYGEACFAYMTNGKAINLFRTVFAGLVLVGAMIDSRILWPIAEIANTLMMGVNMSAVLILDVKTKRNIPPKTNQ